MEAEAAAGRDGDVAAVEITGCTRERSGLILLRERISAGLNVSRGVRIARMAMELVFS